jgi:hypothetical protein
VPTLAGIGERFNATDVIQVGRPSRRLIFAWHLGPKWVIAYEHGGFAYHDHIVADEPSDSGSVGLNFNVIVFPAEVCDRASSWLLGKPPAAAVLNRSDGDW